jgi:hypothetical protein
MSTRKFSALHASRITETVHQTRYCDFFFLFLAQKNREMYFETFSGKLSNNEMPARSMQEQLQQRKLFAPVKNILVLRVLKDNIQNGASGLQHDVTCVKSCAVKVILCVIY